MELALTNTTGRTIKLPSKHYSGQCKVEEKRATKKYLEQRSGERYVGGGFQVQLQEDSGSSKRQSRMETTGLWLCVTGSNKA